MNKRLKELIEETVKTTLLEHSTEYVIISTQSESLGVQHVLSIPIEFCERFAELIAKDCLIEVQRCTLRNGDTEHNRALSKAMLAISKKFGVYEW
jgi:hypothetical protein